MKIISLNIRGFGSGKESKFGDVKSLCFVERPSILALQETKCHNLVDNWLFGLWGSIDCGYVQKEMVGKSGGQLLIWDKNIFEVSSELIGDFFIAIRGKWKKSGNESIIVNVYGLHDDANKCKFWDSLDQILCIDGVSWVICGDFNEVRDKSERLNCEFFENRAKRFNEFIDRNSLVDIPLGGRKFTRVSDDGMKMSKLDRFLVSDDFLNLWTDLKVVALDRSGIDKVIADSWSGPMGGNRKDCVFRNKLKRLKGDLKEWSKVHFGKLDSEIESVKKVVTDLELKAKVGYLNDEERAKWLNSRITWMEMEKIKTGMLKQKVRVRWMLDGDENSKYFHNSLKRKYNKNNIRGINVNGSWCENPNTIKEVAFNHFKNIFEVHSSDGPSLEGLFSESITSADNELFVQSTGFGFLVSFQRVAMLLLFPLFRRNRIH
ncbi:uncharacterized protein [Rutidosis leptorrhynchoides]|uniref:uncharacterized protein n=1 Tax=Rutidosis leptorrhynchoides TaxID=125765 RepID=UPI003A99C496